MSTSQRLLFVTTENPFPADSGGRMRARGFLEVLAESYDIDLVTYARPANDEFKAASSRMNIVAVKRTVTPRFAAIRGLYRRRSFGFMSHADIDLKGPVADLCRYRRYDVAVVDNTMLGHLLPTIRANQHHALLVTVAHNFETSLAEQTAAAQPRPLRKLLFGLSARNARRNERRVCRQTDLLFTTSDEESASFAALSPADASKTRVIPSFVSADTYLRYRRDHAVGASVIFPGDMSFFPNITGALYFYSRIFPILRRECPDIRWLVAGKDCHPSILSVVRDDPSVFVTGYVRDLAEMIATCAAVVVPLLHGSGTRLKILEAWALGRPVVSTSKGCEGMRCVDGHDILIADTAEAFAAAVLKVLRDPGFAREIARNATSTLLLNYDARAVAPRLMASLHA